MLIVGLILLLIGLFAGIGILLWLGLVLLVVGAILYCLGASGRPVGGRQHWY